MAQKKTLNQKRLTKEQVQELIKTEGKLHEEYTQFHEKTYSTGYKEQPLVYELSGDRFLFVFDTKDISLPGKGDIYPKDYFLRRMRWIQKIREDAIHGRQSSVSHWRYYSKHQSKLVNQIDELIRELEEKLNADQLDFSYRSLDTVSRQAEDYGLDAVQSELYDNLVAYVGEVIRRRVNGQWEIAPDSGSYPTKEYPHIKAGTNGSLMPINVVWQELSGLELMNLRKEAANEVRRFSLRER